MSKRVNGEGSVYQRKSDSRWVARLQPDGQKSQSKYAKTQKAATVLLRELQSAAGKGLPAVDGRLTLGTFLRDWLALKKPVLKRSTFTRYESLVRVHITPALGKKPLHQLQPADLSRAYDRFSQPPTSLAPESVRQIRAVLHGALEHAVETGLLGRNVAGIARSPRIPRYEAAFFDDAEVDRLLAAARGDRLEALFLTAVAVGLRQGELLAVRWGDLDLDRAVLPHPSLHVRQRVLPVKGGFEFDEPKSRSSRRRVPLPAAVVEALRHHRTAQLAERLLAGSAWADHDLVFPNALGKPLHPSNLQHRSFEPLLKKAGLPRVTMHALRHTATTAMLRQGIDIRTIAHILGHSDGGALILKTYGHVSPSMLTAAVGAMERRFAAAGSS